MIGGAIAPVLAAYLIQHVGWRHMFSIFGAVGLVWAAAFYLWYRDDPAQHPRVNDAERALIGDTAPRLAAPGEHVRIPWNRVLGSLNTFLLAATMSVSAVLFYMEFQWYPTYLKEGRGVSQIGSGWLTGAVISGGAAGCVAGGLLSDFVLRHTQERKWSYRWCGGICLLFASISVLSVRHVNAVWAVTLCNASALFFVQAAIPTWWAVVARISGRHGAAMWGLMNSMSGLGLMATTRMVAWIIDHRKLAGHSPQDCWPPVFDGVGIVLAAGVLCWLLTDATRSIVEPAAPASA
jgi:MFS family permease